MPDRTIQVRFNDTVYHRSLAVELPRDTRIDTLTPLLYEEGFLAPQKPGYRYLFKNHLCGEHHLLEDYLTPADKVLELEIFRYPQIMV